MTGTKPKSAAKLLIPAAAGLVTGIVVVITMRELSGSAALQAHDASVEFAVFAGLLYAALGIGIGAGLVVPRIAARFLNVEDAAELREQRPVLARSVAATGLIGAALFTVALGGPGQALPPALSAAMAGGFGLGAGLLGRGGTTRADELLRQVSLEGANVGFSLVLGIGGGWAALAHLRLVPPPAPLDWLTLFAVMALAGAFVASGRRGMLAPR